MKRRDFLVKTAVSTAAAALPSLARGASAKKPNILLFFTDDQRAHTIRALGNESVITPNLDKLVGRGFAFNRAYMMGGMTGATCIPSRAMLHTGQHLFHLKAKGTALPKGTVTLGENLRANGYHTFFTGKRHALQRDAIQRGFMSGGVVMGFAGYYTDKRRMPMHDWDPDAKYDKNTGYVRVGAEGKKKLVKDIPGREAALKLEPGPFATDLYVNPAVDFIQDYKDDSPFFMYVALSAPHDPHEAPESVRKLYDPDKIPLPPNFRPEHPFDNGNLEVRDEKLTTRPRDPKVIRQRIADYYSSITHIDAQFGRLTEALGKTGQLDNTIIVFMGDSGLAVGQHGLLGKQNLYDDGGVHVPWIMAGPGVPLQLRSDALVCTCDLYSTLCDLAQVPVPKSVDGKSVRPCFANPVREQRDYVYLAYREFQRAVVGPRYKLIEYVPVTGKNNKTVGSRQTQLFDLKKDPWETTNLAAEKRYASTLRMMQKKLLELREEYEDGTEASRQRCPDMYPQYKMFWDSYLSKG